MNNMVVVGIISLFYIIISQAALSLGISTTVFEYPTELGTISDTNALEILWNLVLWVLNSFGSIMQLAFFTTDLPNIISSIVFAPILLMIFYLGVITVRGGAS